MSLIAKLIVSLIIAVIASTLTTLLLSGDIFSPLLLIAFGFSTIATALITGAGSTPSAASQVSAATLRDTSTAGGDRETGQVKWFNVSKGFGFITRDNGEEIFVHFRSIRGEGRRSLRDGQQVSYVIADSDKGPQAEDVVAQD